MNTRNYFINITIIILFLFFIANFSFAQTTKLINPQQEKLLSGLKVLIWNVPTAQKATVKLRLHSGSAFDPKDKEGTMALLGDILFPNQAAKEFFQEDLGGSLEITSNYDYIQITASSDSDQFIKMLDTIATAITKLNIDKEITAKVRTVRLEKVKEFEQNPEYVADRAVAQRLYGDFPYGKANMGTINSLSKIDFADLIFARQKFLTADNATLAIISNSKPDLVYRAVRRFFGAWQKSDKKIPANFRQPDEPDTKDYALEIPNAENNLQRLALVVPARGDKDFYATDILTEIWRNQFCLNDESKFGKSSFEPNLLRGTYIIRVNALSDKLPLTTGNSCSLIIQIADGKNNKTVYPPISQADFEKAKTKVIENLNQRTSSISDLADLWLDVDTYKLISVKDEIQKANNVTFTDVQRVAENVQKQPFVRVIVKKSGEAKQ